MDDWDKLKVDLTEVSEQAFQLSMFVSLDLGKSGEIAKFIKFARTTISKVLTIEGLLNDFGIELFSRKIAKLCDEPGWITQWISQKQGGSLWITTITNPEMFKWGRSAYIAEWGKLAKDCLSLKSGKTNSDDEDEKEKDEYEFSQGEGTKARLILIGLLRKATKSIDIVDNWINERILGVVHEIIMDTDVSVRLIGTNRGGTFNEVYSSLRRDTSLIEAKITRSSHDRYLIIDGEIVWRLGESIKDLGNKAGGMNKVKDEENKRKRIEDFEEWWAGGIDI